MKRFIPKKAFFSFLIILGCSVDENPNYSEVPFIQFKDIKFIEVGDIADYDTIKLTFSYRDGDSDLGLSHVEDQHFEYPYHPASYFIENGAGDTTAVVPHRIGYYYAIDENPYPNGKLVTAKTRLKPNYAYLPEYIVEYCHNYYVTEDFFVKEASNLFNR